MQNCKLLFLKIIQFFFITNGGLKIIKFKRPSTAQYQRKYKNYYKNQDCSTKHCFDFFKVKKK